MDVETEQLKMKYLVGLRGLLMVVETEHLKVDYWVGLRVLMIVMELPREFLMVTRMVARMVYMKPMAIVRE